MQPSTAALSLVLLAHSVIADNHTSNGTTTEEESSGLDGGAVAGIVIGVVLGVGGIGWLVYYYRARIMKAFGMGGGAAMPKMAAEGGGADTAGRLGGNNLPMMAMRVPGDEQL
jgi:hypothetical protein